jgi:hypothetical protein
MAHENDGACANPKLSAGFALLPAAWGTCRDEEPELTDGMREVFGVGRLRDVDIAAKFAINAEFPADRPSWLGSRRRARQHQSLYLPLLEIPPPIHSSMTNNSSMDMECIYFRADRVLVLA